MTDATPGYKVELYSTGSSISMSGESMSDTGDGVTYQIDDDSKNVFDWSEDVTVYEDGSQSTNVDKINFLSGKVVFSSTPTEPVTVDGHYLTKVQFAQARELSKSISVDALDVTVLGDEEVQRDYGLKDFEAEVNALQFFRHPLDGSGGSEDEFAEQMLNKDKIVLVYYPDSDLDYNERAVVQFSELNITQSPDSVVEGSATFTGAAPGNSFGGQTIFERNR